MDAAVVDPLQDPPDVEPLAESVIAITEEPPAPTEPAESGDNASVMVVREPEADQSQSDDDPDDDDPNDPSGETSEPRLTEPTAPGGDDVASAPVVTPDTLPDGTLDMVVNGSIDVNISGVIDISITGSGEEITDPKDETADPDEVTADVVEGEIAPGETPADEDGAIGPDGDTEDIDVALDNIEIDMTLGPPPSGDVGLSYNYTEMRPSASRVPEQPLRGRPHVVVTPLPEGGRNARAQGLTSDRAAAAVTEASSPRSAARGHPRVE